MDVILARFTVPALIVAISAVVGFLVDRVVVTRIRKTSAKRGWVGGEVTARSLEGIVVVLAVLAGAGGALAWLELSPRADRIGNLVLLVAAIAAVTVVAARLASGLTRAYTSREDTVVPQSTIFVNIVRLAVVAIGVLIALNAMGISITPLLTALGVGGLAVALALQDTLSNLFSGLQLIGSRQIEVGQYIQLDSGEEGYVEDLTWRYTSIRQLTNNLVIVPNSTLAAARIINYHQPVHEMSVRVELGVAYGSDLDLVERVTIETATEVMGRIQEPIADFEPFVRFHTFGDSAIEFSVILRVREYVDQYVLKHEFIKALKARYDAEGIEIPFPQRTVSFLGPGPETPDSDGPAHTMPSLAEED